MAQESGTTKVKGYQRWLPPVLRTIGIIILVGSIALLLVVSVPRLMGMATYDITSGSMEPEIPVGSYVAVQPQDPSTLQEGEVIAFADEGSVIVHRVVYNNNVEGKVFTKGDANDQEDKAPVEYANVIGKVVFNMPVLGTISGYLSTLAGKLYAACLIFAGVLFCVLANQIAGRRRMAEVQDALDIKIES